MAFQTVFKRYELKCSGGIPLWMARVLSRERNGNLELMVSKQENRVAEL